MPEPLADQRAVVIGLLTSATATKWARSALQRVGLAGHAGLEEELVQIVTEKALRRFSAGRPVIGDDLPNALPRYVHVMFDRAAIDLVRAADTRVVTVPLDLDANDPLLAEQTGPLGGASGGDAAAVWNAARAWVWQVADSAEPAWATSAALVHLTMDEAPDVIVPERIVRPTAPAAGQDAAWVALQYAGRDDCFVAPETPAVRKRRSNAIQRVHGILGHALLAARSDDAFGDPTRHEPSQESR